MTNNFDAEAAKKLIYDDNINVTEAHHLKDLFRVLFSLILIIAGIYIFVYVLSGIVLMSLPQEKQIVIEQLISPKIRERMVELSEEDEARIQKVRKKILKVDYKFPKNPNMQVKIVDKNQLNALCYPNGNIYITSELFKYLDTEEKLTFVIAHEMAHYKHKDHLLNLRRNISNNVILILISLASPDNIIFSKSIEDSLDIVDLKYSRDLEAKADIYAVRIMNAIYGNAKAGEEVMKILKEKNRLDIEFISSHPNIDKRIRTIHKYSK